MDREQRKLVAILAGDVAGYSRLMAADEVGTLADLKRIRADIIAPKIKECRGRIVGSAGDSVLVEFASATEAVQCAVEMQDLMARYNAALPEERRMRFRMGINLGDVIADHETIYGDGVNIAARLEKMAEPGGICISRGVHDQVKARLALDFTDLGAAKVHNIPEPVHAYKVSAKGAHATIDKPAASGARETTSIAVLPFVDMSQAQDQGYFADGIAEDLITELSRYRHLSVVSRTSTFAYKGRAMRAQEVGRELNADFVVEGSVRQAGKNVRVTVQLIDAKTGAHSWAERFDRLFEDIFAVQDEIVTAILARLQFNLDEAAATQRQRDSTTNATAYTYCLRARASWRSGDESAAIAQLQEAVRLDPEYARALGQLSFHYAYGMFSRSLAITDREAEARARDFARRATAAAKSDPQTLRVVAVAYLCLGEPQTALRYIEVAAAETLRDINVMLNRGTILVFNGRHEEGLALLDRVSRTEPRMPPGYWASISDGRYFSREYEGSLAALGMIVDPPYYIRLLQAAALGQLGRINEARQIISECPESFDAAMFAQRLAAMCLLPADREHYLDGFRKAGVAI